MLTNLDWLNPGSPYPPASEKERIERCRLHEQLFLTQHTKAWQVKFAEMSRRYRKATWDVETVFNYHQLLSKKIADFVCGEPPTFETEGETDQLLRLLDHQDFNTKLYEAVIDITRYGNAVLKLVDKRLTIASPLYWFPIVDPTDLKTIVQHVIAYPITPDAKGVMTELYVEIHSVGSVEQRTYGYDEKRQEIGTLKEVKTQKTGLQDFAVQVLTNVTHSSSVYGLDDYAVINSIVFKIMWRLHCADTVLDKHSEPSMSGPSSALSFDERTGLWYVNIGNYFKRETKEDPDVSYITWDGNLDNNWKEIELLFNQLYILTEMGQAFAEGGGGGSAESGTALKLKMVSPRVKAARIAGMNAGTVKTVVSLLAQVNGITLDYDTLTITWHDGLPDDPVEQIQMLTTATGGKPIMSQYSALKQRGLTDAEVEEELEQLREEQAASSPFVLGGVDLNSQGSEPQDEPEGAE